MRLKKILCPVDFSDATPFGLRPAISLATQYGSEIILVHVLDYPYPPVGMVRFMFDVGQYYKDMEESATNALADLVDEEVREYAQAHPVVRRGAPYDQIVRLAEEEHVDLIVLPTHAKTAIERALAGSVTEKVVRLAPCPVLTASPLQGEPDAFDVDRVLFTTDFSKHADNALGSAVSIAREYGAELLMVHVVTVWDYDPANPRWRFPPIPEEYAQELEATARARLERSGEQASADGLGVRTLMVGGFDPHFEIVRTAEQEGADLIVMATHGRTGLSHMILGSTAEKVVRHATVPVLTVKSPETAFEAEEPVQAIG